MKYDDLMILASLEFIIICFLVYIGFKLAESFLKKVTKLNEDSISTLNEAKNIQQADE